MRPFRAFRKRKDDDNENVLQGNEGAYHHPVRPTRTLRKHGGGGGGGNKKTSHPGGGMLQRLVGRGRKQQQSQSQPRLPQQKQQNPQVSWEEDSWDSRRSEEREDDYPRRRRNSAPRSLRRKEYNTVPLPSMLEGAPSTTTESQESLDDDRQPRRRRSGPRQRRVPVADSWDGDYPYDDSREEERVPKLNKSRRFGGRRHSGEQHLSRHDRVWDVRDDDEDDDNEGEYGYEVPLAGVIRQPVRVVERQYYYHDTPRDEVEGHEISCDNWSNTSSISSVSRHFYGSKPATTRQNAPTTKASPRDMNYDSSAASPQRSPHSVSTAMAHNKEDAARAPTPLKSAIRPSKLIGRLQTKSLSSPSKRRQPRVRKLDFDPISGIMEPVSVQEVESIPEEQSVDYSIPSATSKSATSIPSKSSKGSKQKKYHAKKEPSALKRVEEIEEGEIQHKTIPNASEETHSKKDPSALLGKSNVPIVANAAPLPPNYSLKCEKDAISMHSSASSASKAKSAASAVSGGSSSGQSSSSRSSKSVQQPKEAVGTHAQKDPEMEALPMQKPKEVDDVEPLPEPENHRLLFQEVDLSSVTSFLESMPSMSSLGASGRSSLSSWTKQFKRVDDPPGSVGIPLVPPRDTPMQPPTEPKIYEAKFGTMDSRSYASHGSGRSRNSTSFVMKGNRGSQSRFIPNVEMGISDEELGIPSISGASLRSYQQQHLEIEVNDSDSSIGLNSLSPGSISKSITSRRSLQSSKSMKSNNSSESKRSIGRFWSRSTDKPVPVSTEEEANRVLPLVPLNSSSMYEDASAALREMLAEEDASEPTDASKASGAASTASLRKQVERSVKSMLFPEVRKVNSDPEVLLQDRPTSLKQQHRYGATSLKFHNVPVGAPDIPTWNSGAAASVHSNDSKGSQKQHDDDTASVAASTRSRASSDLHSIREEEEKGNTADSPCEEVQGIEVTGQIGAARVECLNDERSACSSHMEKGDSKIISTKFSISDGNSIIDSVKESCSHDDADDDHDDFQRVEQELSQQRDAGSVNDNISLNNYIPWRASGEEVEQHRNDPAPMFFQTIEEGGVENDDCSTAATKTLESKPAPAPQRRSVAFADDVSSKAYTEDDSSCSPHSSSVVSQVTMDASLLDNYSFVQFERNFCMDLATNVGGSGNTRPYDQEVMQRYLEMKESKRQQHQLTELRLEHPPSTTGNNRKVKFMDKSKKDGGRGRRSSNGRHRDDRYGPATTLDNTWSMEGIVESVSKIWS